MRRPTRTAPSLLLGLLGTLVLSASPAPAASPETRAALLELYRYDRPLRVDVEVRERLHPEDGRLFGDLPEGTRLHPSYDATVEFCGRFDPYNRSDDEVSDSEILDYLEGLQDTAPLLEAFFVTGRDTLEDLRGAWFRGGRGFEHVVCGESGGGNRLGGYHFWYLHYVYERTGRAGYLGADYGSEDPEQGMADTRIVTGRMFMDPDGPGGMPPMEKRPRGGFTVGHSVAALLAAGHIAHYGVDPSRAAAREGDRGSRDVREGTGGGLGGFAANLNGKAYPWVFHRHQGSIRTLWPRYVPGRLPW